MSKIKLRTPTSYGTSFDEGSQSIAGLRVNHSRPPTWIRGNTPPFWITVKQEDFTRAAKFAVCYAEKNLFLKFMEESFSHGMARVLSRSGR
jgi:hypothetical protein